MTETNDEKVQINIFYKRDTTKLTKKPGGLKLGQGYYWCPYCGIQTRFQKNKAVNIKKCPGCGISENDYWVKFYSRRPSNG